MPDTSTIVVLEQTTPLSLGGLTGKNVLARLVTHVDTALSGNRQLNYVRVFADGALARNPYATITFSGASGTVGAVINGITLTFTHGASDIADGTTLSANLNASTDPLVQYLAQACNLANTVTCASVAVADFVDIAGVRLTAVAGTNLQPWEFSQSGTDTADGASLAAQINAHPNLKNSFVAINAAGVVSIRQIIGTTAAGVVFSNNATRLAVSGALAATAVTLITSIAPGILGNCMTLAASGTGVTASTARLSNGTGGAVVPTNFIL